MGECKGLYLIPISLFHRRSASKHALYIKCADIKLNFTVMGAVCPSLTLRGTLSNSAPMHFCPFLFVAILSSPHFLLSLFLTDIYIYIYIYTVLTVNQVIIIYIYVYTHTRGHTHTHTHTHTYYVDKPNKANCITDAFHMSTKRAPSNCLYRLLSLVSSLTTFHPAAHYLQQYRYNYRHCVIGTYAYAGSMN